MTGDATGELCHYTTCEGALGIINSQSLWLNDTAYMDDINEVHLSSQVLSCAGVAAINDRCRYKNLFELFRFHCGHKGLQARNSADIAEEDIRHACSDGYALEDKLREQLGKKYRIHPITYTFSLCPSSDNPRLWDRYAKSNDGVALIFDVGELHRLSETRGMRLQPIVYWDIENLNYDAFEDEAERIIKNTLPKDAYERVGLLFQEVEGRVKLAIGDVYQNGYPLYDPHGHVRREEWHKQNEQRLMLRIPTDFYAYASAMKKLDVSHGDELMTHQPRMKQGRIKRVSRCEVEYPITSIQDCWFPSKQGLFQPGSVCYQRCEALAMTILYKLMLWMYLKTYGGMR